MEKPLINRVANSGLITLNLEDYLPSEPILHFDLKDYLFMELILKEKDFRERLKSYDWTQYKGKIILVYCSTDAIIPLWAYMLIASYAAPFAATIFQGNLDSFYTSHFRETLQNIDYKQYTNKRIVIKGCGEKAVPPAAYLEITRHLQVYAQNIMFGEPCSTVPIYKRPRVLKK